MVNAQEWLDREYPKEIRKNITELNISEKELESSLKLEHFVNLEKLLCRGNQLTSLDVSMCQGIKKIYCARNQLVNLNLDNCFELEWLNCSDNRLSELNVSNLRKLSGLYCGGNKITKLDVNGLVDLRELGFSNLLTELNTDSCPNLQITKYCSSRTTTLKSSINKNYQKVPSIDAIPTNLDSRKSTGGKSPRKQLATKMARKSAPSIIQNWSYISRGFAEKSHCNYSLENKTYKQEWEERGFNYEQAKEWIKNGWKPSDIYSVNQWKNLRFNLQESKEWAESGLNKSEYEFAYYLREKSLEASNLNNLRDLRKEFNQWLIDIRKDAQKWLDYFYPKENRETITHLDVSAKKLKGRFNLNSFSNLRILDCFDNKLTSLNLVNCEKLTCFNCGDNQLTTLNLPKEGKKLNFINLRDNKLKKDLTFFSNLDNLEELWIGNNNFFGSLTPLQNLNELKNLDVENNNINSGLEHLPRGLKKIWCDSCESLKKELKPYSKKDKADYGDGKVYTYYDYQIWRKKNEEKSSKQLKQLISDTKPNLNSEEIVKRLSPYNIKDINSYNGLKELFSLLGLSLDSEVNTKLVKRVEHLTDLIKKQKEKIVQSYLYFAPEKEILQDLIKAQLELTKFERQGSNSPNYGIKSWEYEKRYGEIKNKLFTKLTEREKINEVQKVIVDCKQLVDWEIELEEKLNSKQLLPEEENQIPQITAYHDDNKSITYHEQIIQELTDIEQNTIKPKLEYLIGKGGGGEVYYGKQGVRKVAVKKLCLVPNGISQNDIKEITNEINILKKLQDRHIIQYYGTYSDNQELFIIMDYAENGTLTKFIDDNKSKPHDWNFNNELIRQMALGLGYIHQANIIHRDLKSMNILLTNNYRQVKISDFGLSRIKGISVSQSKNIKGTLEWMAPELLNSLESPKYSEKSDIYALGMVIWEIVAKCTRPFKDTHDNSIYIYIISNRKETIPGDTPKDIHDIIERCWRDNPSERITLTKILETIKDDEVDFQDFKNSSKDKSGKKINDQFHDELLTINSSEISLTNTNLFNNNCYSTELDFDIDDNNQIIKESKINQEESDLLINRTKRQLSLETQTKIVQAKDKLTKVDEEQELQEEPMEIDHNLNKDWTNIRSSFTSDLISQWQNLNFTYSQTQDWMNIGLQPIDYNFCAWLRDELQLEPLEILNNMNTEDNYQEADLKEQFQEYQSQIEIPPK